MASTPEPFVALLSGSWDGDDGSWSTFQIGVGTPPQLFRVLPSTTGADLWIPDPAGCEGILADVSDCGMLRGADDINNVPSRGFQTNLSSTWETIGVYRLPTERNLWPTAGTNGFFGLDTISISQSDSDVEAALSSQVVGAVATEDVWLGSLGLGTAMANFSVQSQDRPSFLDSMKAQKIIPSLSFGYTAGASYTQTSGSLVLGGYDSARFTPSELNLPTDGQSLPIQVKSIVAENVAAGTLSLLPKGTPLSTTIDSTVSQLYLPQRVCDLFANAFNLTYDPSTELYLVDDDAHKQLKQLNPSVTFTVGAAGVASATADIVFPYAAFDLQAGIPLFNYSTNYFPIRVAATENQHVLGRAFLHEAYVAVDWERANFTLGQAIHQDIQSDIVAITPPHHSGSLSSGILAAVAIGAVALLASIIGLAIFFVIRSRRRPASRATATRPLVISKPIPIQAASNEFFEMDHSDAKHELVCHQITELFATPASAELYGTYGRQSRHMTKKDEEFYELP